jgi:glycosyltransferase involved in cell wall biosynthesis
MLLSLVVPVYREEKNIPEFLRRIGPILGAITQDYEIIFAMDPSPDRTEDVILELRAKLTAGSSSSSSRGGSGSRWRAWPGCSTPGATP